MFESILDNQAEEIHYLSLGDHRFATLALQLDALALKYERLDLFGWSLGALFALRWSLMHQEKSSSLFLTGATAKFCGSAAYSGGIDPKKIEQMSRMLPLKTTRVMSDFYASAFEQVARKEELIQHCLEHLPPLDALQNGLEELMQIDLLDKLPLVQAPVFILQGDQDRITPLQGAQELQQRLANGHLHVVSGGHAPFLEVPEQVTTRWKEFLCTIH
jgi:pimeloyl-ACP methyl ester carboxylesterase